jgi:hypothetical protein
MDIWYIDALVTWQAVKCLIYRQSCILFLRSSYDSLPVCLSQTKHGILLCKVSALSLSKQLMDQNYFPVHTNVLITCNNFLLLWTQTADTFSFSFFLLASVTIRLLSQADKYVSGRYVKVNEKVFWLHSHHSCQWQIVTTHLYFSLFLYIWSSFMNMEENLRRFWCCWIIYSSVQFQILFPLMFLWFDTQFVQ